MIEASRRRTSAKPEEMNLEGIDAWLSTSFDRHQRLSVLLSIADEMDGEEWLTLLGKWWTTFTHPDFHIDALLRRLHEIAWDMEAVIPEMMSEAEDEAFEQLPEVITIYRACVPGHMLGACWSLDRQTALTFPFREVVVDLNPGAPDGSDP
jgi:hypothetical protein